MEFGPPFPLGFHDVLPGGGAHLPLGFRGLGDRGQVLGADAQQAPDRGDVGIQPRPLGFETLKGGGEEFGSEIQAGHVGRKPRMEVQFRSGDHITLVGAPWA